MSHLPPQPSLNRLLAALPDADYTRLSHHLELVSFALGEVVYEPGAQLTHVYFPLTSIVSLLYTMMNGGTAEMGLVGNEGVVGIALFMGGETTPNRAVVQGGGECLRMPARALQEEFRRGGAFQLALLRYTQGLITQISQTAVCNRLHTIDQRLCRWLLMTHDRAGSDELQMTHEFMANMLGIRREGVTLAAHRLQSHGIIKYVRGHLRIIDRSGLEHCVCECYRVVKDELDRLLT